MKELTTSIEIGAPATWVWRVLTDFADFPTWNPFIREAEGTLRPGSRLTLRMVAPGGREMMLRPRVIVADPERELRWRGHLYVPGLLDGDHALIIEPIDAGRVRFTQRERFSGVLVPLLKRRLETGVKRSLEGMNRALKARSEAASPASLYSEPAPP